MLLLNEFLTKAAEMCYCRMFNRGVPRNAPFKKVLTKAAKMCFYKID